MRSAAGWRLVAAQEARSIKIMPQTAAGSRSHAESNLLMSQEEGAVLLGVM